MNNATLDNHILLLLSIFLSLATAARTFKLDAYLFLSVKGVNGIPFFVLLKRFL